MFRRYLLLVAAACILFSSCSNSGKKDICVQLYSLRGDIGSPELWAKNSAAELDSLKAWGYTSVEAACYEDGTIYGLNPKEYKKQVEAAGLKSLSSHVARQLSSEEMSAHDFTAAMKWWDKCIDTHKKAGCRYLVYPWAPVPKDLTEAQTFCDYLNEIGKRVGKAGMRFGYHTHSHEFGKVEDQIWIDYLMQNTNPDYVFWQMDVYWCAMAQQYPSEWIRKYPGRFALLHIKDHYEIGESGLVDFESIFRNAGAVGGLEGYVVELENTDGSITNLDGLRRSAEYLKNASWVPAHIGK